MKKISRALYIGRFQPFHKGHENVVKKLLKKYQEIIIVVGSAENLITFKNPFTAGERLEMIRRCFDSKELARLIVVPIRDTNNNSLWVSHLLSYLPKFHVVYSNNNIVKTLFSRAAIPVSKILFHDRQKYEGNRIRTAILLKKEWKRYLPEKVVGFIENINGDIRIKKLTKVPIISK